MVFLEGDDRLGPRQLALQSAILCFERLHARVDRLGHRSAPARAPGDELAHGTSGSGLTGVVTGAAAPGARWAPSAAVSSDGSIATLAGIRDIPSHPPRPYTNLNGEVVSPIIGTGGHGPRLTGMIPDVEDLPSLGRIYASSRALAVERSPLTLKDVTLLAAASSFDSVGAYISGSDEEMTIGGEPVSISLEQVSAGFFPAMRGHAATGRLLSLNDFREGAPVVVMTDRTWRASVQPAVRDHRRITSYNVEAAGTNNVLPDGGLLSTLAGQEQPQPVIPHQGF